MRTCPLVPVLAILATLALSFPAEALQRGGARGSGGGGFGGGGFRGGGFRGGFGSGFHSGSFGRGSFGSGFRSGGFRGGAFGNRFIGGGLRSSGFRTGSIFGSGFRRGSGFLFGFRDGRSRFGFGHGKFGFGHGKFGFGHGKFGFGHGRFGRGHFFGGVSTVVVPGFFGYPFGYYGFGYPYYGSGAYYPTTPTVVDASTTIVNPPGSAAGSLNGLNAVPPSSPGDRHYLDARTGRGAIRLTDLARTQIRVERAEPGMYLVRWVGSVQDVSVVEFQAVDATGQVLASKRLREAPFRGLLRVPEKTAAVLVTVEQKSGASATVKLPLDEFKALDPIRDLKPEPKPEPKPEQKPERR